MNDLETLFKNYQREAFRFELLPEYSVENELEDFEEFKRSGKFSIDEDTQEYLNAVEAKIKAGARHIRSRVLDDPLNDYQKFEIVTGYLSSSVLGTEFYFVDRADFLTSPFGTIGLKDFWLFDDASVAFLMYTPNGEFSGFRIGNAEEIAKCIELKEWIIINSYNLEQLLKRYPRLNSSSD
jgi:hypothetical protein